MFSLFRSHFSKTVFQIMIKHFHFASERYSLPTALILSVSKKPDSNFTEANGIKDWI